MDKISYAEYQLAIAQVNVALMVDSKIGSPEELEAMRLARVCEDYELQMAGRPFEAEYTSI
jgi:hypothetical protein